MDIRILTLLVFVSIAGTLGEVHSHEHRRIMRNVRLEDGRSASVEFLEVPRAKRAVDESNDATTISPAKPTEPSDQGQKTTTDSTTAKPDVGSRSNFEPSEGKPQETNDAPSTTTTTTTTAKPSPSTPGMESRIAPDSSKPTAANSPMPRPSTGNSMPSYNNELPNFIPGFVPAFDPRFSPYGGGQAPFNSMPGTGGNYAWTGTYNGPGSASAAASASSSSGGFAGTGGYPMNNGMPDLGSRGAFVDNGGIYPGGYPSNGVGPSSYGPNTFGFPQNAFNPDPFNIQAMVQEHFRQVQAQIEEQQRAMLEASNGIGNDGLSGGSDGPQTAFSSINVGPRGGFQTGFIQPGAPGLESRFAEELPPPSGNSFGVFSSSSSSSRTGPDGKTISRKSATTGVNDNGKVTFRTVHD